MTVFIPLLRIYENLTGSFTLSLPLPGFKTVVLHSSCVHLTSRRSLSGRCAIEHVTRIIIRIRHVNTASKTEIFREKHRFNPTVQRPSFLL
jgi:hypothetical protein